MSIHIYLFIFILNSKLIIHFFANQKKKKKKQNNNQLSSWSYLPLMRTEVGVDEEQQYKVLLYILPLYKKKR